MIILNKEHREIYSREVTREIPNSETISAINEVQQMKQNPSLGKSYTDIDKMMIDLTIYKNEQLILILVWCTIHQDDFISYEGSI